MNLVIKGKHRGILYIGDRILYFSYGNLVGIESKDIGKFRTKLNWSKSTVNDMISYGIENYHKIDQLELEKLAQGIFV